MIEALSGMVNFENLQRACNITIAGGTVSAQSTNGAGIGSGAVIYDVSDGSEVSKKNTPEVIGGTITVSGGTVSAQSVRGAGIGGGSGQVTVDPDAQTPPSLTPYSSDGGTVTISGGTVEAVSTEGVGIGSGGMPFYQSESPPLTNIFIASAAKLALWPVRTGTPCSFATGKNSSH